MSRNTPLRVDIENSELIIRIGIETLTWSSRPKNYGPLEDCHVIKGREFEFAQDVARELEQDDEIGETKLMKLIDWAMTNASYSSGAVKWKKKQN